MPYTSYSTDAEVRYEAGFKNNTNILDGDIEVKRKLANARINSIVGKRYALPLSDNIYRNNSNAKDLLNGVEILLAAGYLLDIEYAEDALDTDKSGNEKIKKGEEYLLGIENGTIGLLGSDGGLLDPNTQQTEQVQIRGYPTNSCDRKFSINDKR